MCVISIVHSYPIAQMLKHTVQHVHATRPCHAEPKRPRRASGLKIPSPPPVPLKPLPMGTVVLPSAAAAILSLIFDHGMSDIKELIVSRGLQPTTVIKVWTGAI